MLSLSIILWQWFSQSHHILQEEGSILYFIPNFNAYLCFDLIPFDFSSKGKLSVIFLVLILGNSLSLSLYRECFLKLSDHSVTTDCRKYLIFSDLTVSIACFLLQVRTFQWERIDRPPPPSVGVIFTSVTCNEYFDSYFSLSTTSSLSSLAAEFSPYFHSPAHLSFLSFSKSSSSQATLSCFRQIALLLHAMSWKPSKRWLALYTVASVWRDLGGAIARKSLSTFESREGKVNVCKIRPLICGNLVADDL